jgi:lysophospholipase L1-like esterase
MQMQGGLKLSIRKRGLIGSGLVLLATAISAMAFAPGASASGKEPFYMAMGDSITFGYRQQLFNENLGTEPPSVFEEGPANFFAKGLGKGTTIVNLACPGETSNSLIGENAAIGGGTSTEEKKRMKDWRPCVYHKSGLALHYSLGPASQLEEALAILKEGHPAHEVTAITLNIGSNDELSQVAQCKEEHPTELPACLGSTAAGLFEHIANNIGDIIGVLDSTAAGGGHYTGPIIVLGFYNPQSIVLPGSDALQKALNSVIAEKVVPLFPNAHFAPIFPVFNKGGTATKEQKSICKYTEMCNPAVQQEGGMPPGKDGDIHPSVKGAKAIAKAELAAR